VFDNRSVLESVRQWGEEAAKAADSALWPLRDDELVGLLQAAHRAQQAMIALQVRAVQEAATRDLPAQHGHRTTAAWLRAHLLIDPQPARDLADASAALRLRPTVEQALITGRIDSRQAAVIAAAVNAIPATLAETAATVQPATNISVDPAANATADRTATATVDSVANATVDSVENAPDAVAERAEAALIEMAGQLPAYQLRKLGDRILAHVAPEIAERAEEAALRRAENRAHRQRYFTISNPVEGRVRLSGLLGVEDAAILSAALEPLTGPVPNDDRSFPQRRADALVEVCRLALRTGELPRNGGEPPQLTVTVRFDPLSSLLGTGLLPDGQRLSAATARRLACDARIVPIVLGGASQILDAGRGRRLAHGVLRRALAVRDGGCAFPACDRPARWCDAHHLRPWSDGGATDLDNLVLLCRHHHRQLHDPTAGWQATLGADRLPTFTPPPWIDPERRPRRNLYHPRT
jgi:hypothetical protein